MRCKKCRLKHLCRKRGSNRTIWEVLGEVWGMLSWSLYLCCSSSLCDVLSSENKRLVSSPAPTLSLRGWCNRNSGRKYHSFKQMSFLISVAFTLERNSTILSAELHHLQLQFLHKSQSSLKIIQASVVCWLHTNTDPKIISWTCLNRAWLNHVRRWGDCIPLLLINLLKNLFRPASVIDSTYSRSKK